MLHCTHSPIIVRAVSQGRDCSVRDIKKSPTISEDANSVFITKVKRFSENRNLNSKEMPASAAMSVQIL